MYLPQGELAHTVQEKKKLRTEVFGLLRELVASVQPLLPDQGLDQPVVGAVAGLQTQLDKGEENGRVHFYQETVPPLEDVAYQEVCVVEHRPHQVQPLLVARQPRCRSCLQ